MAAPDMAASRAGAAPGLAGKLARLLRDPFTVAGLTIYAVLIIVAVFADQLMTHDPGDILFRANGRVASNQPPSAAYLLGTTNLGRDVYSQLIGGSRIALVVGFTAAICVAAFGTLIGLLAGYFGGKLDAILMRLADLALAIPFLPFAIVLAGFSRSSTTNVIVAVVLLLWPNTARVIRAQVLTVKERAYVEAARVTGASDARILFVHVAPNILPLTFLYGSVAIGWAILTEAAVSFVGFGDAKNISWGYMLQDAFVSQALSRGSWHWFVPPGLCIILVVIAGFFIARGAEDVLFPKLRS
ncbi:MAG: ABC transporter permease [Hyphomicrobiales bacterium]|nr:ABC transporter permease [Hyphomicrobiales bacterium]